MRVALAVCRLVFCATTLAGCDLVFGLETPAHDFVFDNAAGRTDLVDLPVLIPLEPASFSYATVEDPTTDLQFVDPSSGDELPYEVNVWDPEGRSEIWVHIPRIAHGSTTDHVVLSSGADVGTGGAIPGEVWHEQELVLHAEQLDRVADASRKFSPVATGVTLSPGVVGSGFGFAAGGDVTITNGHTLLAGWAQFTIELWIHPDTTTITSATPVPNLIERPGPIQALHLGINDTNQLELTAELNFEQDGALSVSTTIPTQAWSYVVFVGDGAELRVYKNGVLVDTTPSTHALVGSTPNQNVFQIGGRRFDGALDEIRIAPVARSADWLLAEYRSMTHSFLLAP